LKLNHKCGKISLLGMHSVSGSTWRTEDRCSGSNTNQFDT